MAGDFVGVPLFVAYANGADDYFKGVATLFGSGTSGYCGALAWATITTLGGICYRVFRRDQCILTAAKRVQR